MPDRLDSYRRLLRTALDAGYVTTSVERHWRRLQGGADDPTQRYLVVRHDIDTDPGTARAMWDIERDLGVESSYFFRLSTLDLPLMTAIARAGSAASYHYEELASLAKRYRIRDRETLLGWLPKAREAFAVNLDRLRRRTGLPIDVVASHGDFTNRALGVSNTEILADEAFRRDVAIDLEAYDAKFMDRVDSRHADDLGPGYWRPSDPAAAIERRERVVYLLLHPRNWRANRFANVLDDVRRVYEGIRYRVSPASTPAPQLPVRGAAPSARIHPGVSLGPGSAVGEFVILGEPASGAAGGARPLTIGARANIRSHTVLYAGSVIGDRFQTGHGVLVREDCQIGSDVSIGSHSVLEHHVSVGDGVRIHSNAFVPEFSVLEAGSWVGPNAVFTNARYPRSTGAKDALAGPHVLPGAKIGANATLLPGVVVGRDALVGAGSVVTHDIPEGSVAVGNPARVVGAITGIPAYAEQQEKGEVGR